MKITFYSNFLNHHQLPFCSEMVKLIGNNFKFVATEKIPVERINLGYKDMNSEYDFVVKSYENGELASELLRTSDVIIIGSAPNKYIRGALKNKKLCFRYNERKFKDNRILLNFINYVYILLSKTILEKNVYLLCASAFASRDFNIAGAYIGRCYKWGYFPRLVTYENFDYLLKQKEENSILWVGRFIDFKHPEFAIYLAKSLCEKKYDFKLTMIGVGPLKNKIVKLVSDFHLQEHVVIYDSMPPESVRKYMEKSQIYIFTSDKGEGWGAVLNEALNSACVVVADSKIGSVPYMIKDGENGIIYNSYSNFVENVEKIIIDTERKKEIAINAYNTIINEWNASVAATRFYNLCDNLLSKSKNIISYNHGPCSKAHFLKNNWYKKKGDMNK